MDQKKSRCTIKGIGSLKTRGRALGEGPAHLRRATTGDDLPDLRPVEEETKVKAPGARYLEKTGHPVCRDGTSENLSSQWKERARVGESYEKKPVGQIASQRWGGAGELFKTKGGNRIAVNRGIVRRTRVPL